MTIDRLKIPATGKMMLEKRRTLWQILSVLLFFSVGFAAAIFLSRHEEYPTQNMTSKTDYRSVPPEWLGFQQVSLSVFPIESEPVCFTALDDKTFVVGTANPAHLFFFDDLGTLSQTFSLPEAPQAVAGVGKIGEERIYIAFSQSIAVYDLAGKCLISQLISTKKLGLRNAPNIQSLVETPDYLFAADSGNRCVFRLDKTRLDQGGNVDLTFGEDFAVYASPMSLTYSQKNNLLYVANPGKHRVEVFTQEGIPLPEKSWGEPSSNVNGFAGCCNPIGLAAMEDGRIVTVEKSVSRIKVFAEGKLESVVASADILESFPAEIRSVQSNQVSIEPGGRYFSAACLSGGKMAVFDFDRHVLRLFVPLMDRP